MNKKMKIMISSGVIIVLLLGGTIVFFSRTTGNIKKTSKQNVYSQVNASSYSDSTSYNEQIQKVEEEKANAPAVIYSPARNWTPTLPKVSNASPVTATTKLTDTDISRLQSYKQYLSAGGSTSEVAASFQDLYTNKPKSCESILQKFSPIKFEDYKNAKVEWLTKPSLVYKNAIAQYCIRGIIQLTFYSDNKFGLKTNQKYECDVEYDVTYGVFNDKSQAVLGSVDYLSDFKAVK